MLLILSFSTKLSAQDNVSEYKSERKAILGYKKFYKYADSIGKNGQTGFIEKDVYRVADSLDNLHPAEYFTKAAKLMGSYKLNEASFIYYLGYLRYEYYNSVNPAYKDSGDGALFASLHYQLGEPLLMMLKSNIENYIGILKKSIDWGSKHDYKFFSKNRNPKKYLLELEGLNNTLADLKKNKEHYKKEWAKEREDSEKGFDLSLKQINDKLKKEQKTHNK